MTGRVKRRTIVDFLASVKTAIPLLVVIAIASVLGSLIPQGRNVRLTDAVPESVRQLNAYLQLNDIFHSWWYLALLGLLAISLLAVTVKRVPAVYKSRGRGLALGILLAHVGVVLMIGSMIYGGFSGFRYYTRLIEGEVTVVPQLPFVMKLERFDFHPYAPEVLSHRGAGFQMAEKQESVVTLFRHGYPTATATTAPGLPLRARGITFLPSQQDVGWTFELILQAGGQEKVVPVRPWAPPLITLGLGDDSQIITHRLITDDNGRRGLAKSLSYPAAEVFLLEPGGGSRSLGFATQQTPLRFKAWNISVGTVRRYTGLQIYSRPETSYLVGGVGTLFLGLIGYFTRWGVRLIPHLRIVRKTAAPMRPQTSPVRSKAIEQAKNDALHAVGN